MVKCYCYAFRPNHTRFRSMLNNPSVCSLGLNLDGMSRAYCYCALPLVGTDFCVPNTGLPCCSLLCVCFGSTLFVVHLLFTPSSQHSAVADWCQHSVFVSWIVIILDIVPFVNQVGAATSCQPYTVPVLNLLISDLCSTPCCRALSINTSTDSSVSIVTLEFSYNGFVNTSGTVTCNSTGALSCENYICLMFACKPLPNLYPKWRVFLLEPFLFVPVPVNATIVAVMNSFLDSTPLPRAPINYGSVTSSVVYQLSAVPPGLTLNPSLGTVSGTPIASGIVASAAYAHDRYTNARVFLGIVTFNVVVCGPTVCKFGGICKFPYDNLTCDCTNALGQGPVCAVITLDSAGSSAGQMAGLVIAVVGGVAILVTAVTYFARRYDNRKTFHIFISYRVATDVKMAQYIYHQLQGRFLSSGHRVR